MNEHGYVSVRFYLQQQVESSEPSLPASALKHYKRSNEKKVQFHIIQYIKSKINSKDNQDNILHWIKTYFLFNFKWLVIGLSIGDLNTEINIPLIFVILQQTC